MTTRGTLIIITHTVIEREKNFSSDRKYISSNEKEKSSMTIHIYSLFLP